MIEKSSRPNFSISLNWTVKRREICVNFSHAFLSVLKEFIYVCIHLFLYLRFVGRIRASEYDLKVLILFLRWLIRPVEVFSDGEQVIFESH